MAVGRGTAAASVAFGLIFLVMGLLFTVIGNLYGEIVPMFVSIPMVCVGVVSTLFGYILFHVHGKKAKAKMNNNLSI